MRLRRPVALLLAAVLCGQARADPPAPGDYAIDGDASSLHVLVYRGGMLGRLGHNHVVAIGSLSGHVTVPGDPRQARLSLVAPVSGFAVDDPDAREAEGGDFPGVVPEDDKSGTRANMLGPKLLDLPEDAELNMESTGVEGNYPKLVVTVSVEIRGKSQELRLPVTIDSDGRRLVADGETRIRHEALGLRPFSAALGALRVKDELVFRYRIVAARMDEDDAN